MSASEAIYQVFSISEISSHHFFGNSEIKFKDKMFPGAFIDIEINECNFNCS